MSWSTSLLRPPELEELEVDQEYLQHKTTHHEQRTGSRGGDAWDRVALWLDIIALTGTEFGF